MKSRAGSSKLAVGTRFPRLLLLAYAFTNVALYSMLLPLWEGFDEPFHFGYVQSLANGNGFPDPRESRLTEEVGASLLLAPASLLVQRNLPKVTSYPEFFAWPESRREEAHQQLRQIDPALRWRPGDFLNYEAQHAPFGYAVLALPERTLARVRLPARVLLLRLCGGLLGAILLFFAAERLATQLRIPDPYRNIAIFCVLSSQMIWATLAHVDNDWLAVPLTVWLLVMVIHYDEKPGLRRAALAALVLSIGLLTKAYCMAFVPLLGAICIFRRRWGHLAIAMAIVTLLAGPWYLRNVERYGTISGMQEAREGTDVTAAWHDIRLTRIPAAIDSYARAALWTANNTFRSFSTVTLRVLMAVWLAALLLWASGRHERAEWIVLLHAGLFAAALAYDIAINYVHSLDASPCAWYTQVLLVPMLLLALLGASRSPKAGKVVAISMTLLYGYILVTTYWVKLIPLYSGFEARTSLSAVAMLYRQRLSALMTGLNEVCLAPAKPILLLSALVSVLALYQQVNLILSLNAGARTGARTGARGRGPGAREEPGLPETSD